MQGPPSTPSYALRAPVGLVIAHPDDESMFFAPALVYLARNKSRTMVLCLSSGDFDGQGQTRKRELFKACTVLGVKEEDVFIMEHADLQDGSEEPWPTKVVAQHVRDFVQKNGVKTLLTFDKGGVSGHSDHAAVHRGVVQFLRTATTAQPSGNKRNETDNDGTRTGQQETRTTVVDGFELATTGIFRKYLGLLDLPLSLVLSRPYPLGVWFVSFSARRAWRAMAAHHSQFVWYRRLFVIFSRYAYVNTFRRIPTL